jgi:hypothetical protein
MTNANTCVTYSHSEVVLENDRFSSVSLIRRKTQAMQRIGEALQRGQRDGGKVSNSKTTSLWLYLFISGMVWLDSICYKINI